MAFSIELTGRKAMVSGVTSGIGAAVAMALAEAGCDVSGCGLESESSRGAVMFLNSVRAMGGRAQYLSIDLSQPTAPGQWLKRAAADLGGVDIVVSNAGRNVFKGASECSEQDWAECINLDLASHWRLAKAAFPMLMRSAHAVVLLISSNHAQRTIPGCFPYNVAKAGINSLVQSLAIEWAPRVRAVGIAPGFVETPGNDAWFAKFPDPEAQRKTTEQRHPVGRLGMPRDIADLCVFLASDRAGFISGTTILADGGRSALLEQP